MENQMANSDGMSDVDPWEAAFAAINKIDEKDSEGDAATGGDEPNPAGNDPTAANGEQKVPDSASATVSTGNEGSTGNLDTDTGVGVEEDGQTSESLFRVPDGFSDEYRKHMEEDVRNQAINDIAEEFVKRGVRNTNGKLGATLDDSDICKRDEDGVPHFYNPETGREFTGDNPRRQAQEWVDDYNKELARVFNDACAEYENHLMTQRGPALAVIEFAPKYEKLDPIRRGMFEDVIKDYEVTDGNGKVVGYSCDLDKALALVDRQVKTIQAYAKLNGNNQQPAPTGPALDMKTSSGAVAGGDRPTPTSLAEAMEMLQDAQLEKIRKK